MNIRISARVATPQTERSDEAGGPALDPALDPPLDPALDLALDRYVISTSSVLIRVLGERCRAFTEPRTSSPHAARRLGFLVETLLGVAAGAVLGQVLGVARGALGREVSDRLARRLPEAMRQLGQPVDAAPSGALLPVRPVLLMLDPVPRPLVETLWLQLHGRLSGARTHHRHLLQQMAAALPLERATSLAAVLGPLHRTTTLAEVWSRHLELAWRFFALAAREDRAVEPELPPELAAGAAADAWRAWLRRARGSQDPSDRRR